MVSKFQKMVHHIGYDSVPRYIVAFALPILGVIFAFSIATSFLSMLPKMFPFIIAVLGVGFVFFYPLAIFGQKATGINNKLHLMIRQDPTDNYMYEAPCLHKNNLREEHYKYKLSKQMNHYHEFESGWDNA